MAISDHKITPEKMASTIVPILPILNNSLKSYFEKILSIYYNRKKVKRKH
ncbi:MAG: hypothetical protein ACL7BU_14480 [Candidatus Phlomobacter fragariae]